MCWLNKNNLSWPRYKV